MEGREEADGRTDAAGRRAPSPGARGGGSTGEDKASAAAGFTSEAGDPLTAFGASLIELLRAQPGETSKS